MPAWTNCAGPRAEGKDWIAQLQQDEIARTGIASLKVRFNSVFGYYIEVTKSNLDKVPAHYIRKQTIAGGRAVHHAGVEGNGGQNPRRGGARREAGVRIVPARARTGAGTVARACSKPPRRWRNWTCWPPSPRRPACTTIAARNRRRMASLQIRDGRHPVLEQTHGRRTVRAQRRLRWTTRSGS